ncbi:MAG TPA: MBL fold metallo-hydrolase [Solirubrobacteraceae bacterium]|nr:MBL fold metallo-hydrolase [Solirubrobacteraceae bacterium]
MVIERATHPQFVSNTYLVAAGEGGAAFLVDAGGPLEPIFAAAQKLGVEPTHLLLTHHHYDHVSETPALRERWPGLVVMASAPERALLDRGTFGPIEPLEAGDELAFGPLGVRALATPGHTAGMLSLLVAEGGEQHVFTGDTLFRGSVGGVRAPGHTTYADLRSSIMDTLMGLDPATVIEPGHAAATSVAREWQENPFIRVWRGLDAEGTQPCTALGEPATLILLADDYDGGTKAWVRWADGSDDIVPGSQVA